MPWARRNNWGFKARGADSKTLQVLQHRLSNPAPRCVLPLLNSVFIHPPFAQPPLLRLLPPLVGRVPAVVRGLICLAIRDVLKAAAAARRRQFPVQDLHVVLLRHCLAQFLRAPPRNVLVNVEHVCPTAAATGCTSVERKNGSHLKRKCRCKTLAAHNITTIQC